MAPKHGLSGLLHEEELLAKRAKSSDTQESRASTPADPGAKVPFEVKYPVMDSTKKLSKREQDLVDAAEFQISPFKAKGAKKDGELDQYYTVTPTKEWESMKKYNNFISKSSVGFLAEWLY